MTLTDKEKQGFDKVMNIFKSVIDECRDGINIILDNDPELKEKVEDEVARIMKIRKVKKVK